MRPTCVGKQLDGHESLACVAEVALDDQHHIHGTPHIMALDLVVPWGRRSKRNPQNAPADHQEPPMKRIRTAVPTLALTALAALAATGALAQDANLARNLAATCANCHGTNGQARGDMKPLAGVSADKIVAALADYKSGNQPATIMHQISKGYTDEQVKLIAAFFAAQKPAK
jgi:cytochrome c553